MSLATQCPHCRTTFKVANDQLTLHAGLVRCGICQQIFNGVEHLTESQVHTQQHARQNDQPLKPTFLSASDGSDLQSSLESSGLPTLSFNRIDKDEKASILEQGSDLPACDRAVSSELTDSPQATNSSGQETKLNQAEPQEGAALCAASKSDDEADIAQLSFIRQASTKARFKRLVVIGVVMLGLLLLGQATYLFRNLIAASYPPAKETLITLCKYIHCQIDFPEQLDALVFEAAEVHTLPRENTFEFSLLMRNNSLLTQAWPHVELTLQNEQKQAILRRVFSPADYLASLGKITSGFPAHQQQAVQVYFEMAQAMASDFSVAIFYP